MARLLHISTGLPNPRGMRWTRPQAWGAGWTLSSRTCHGCSSRHTKRPHTKRLKAYSTAETANSSTTPQSTSARLSCNGHDPTGSASLKWSV